ncbi:MAG: hypothetical protein COA49_00990 [Bacteroidetes bacterium]|nr:MAG: hypothetical protein COA49_00990 [Bacteroidota bacterium]
MSESSRVFFFTADSSLSDSSSTQLLSRLTTFLDSWSAHGSALTADALLISNRVLLISVDESSSSASGCSLDSLNNFIKKDGESIGVDWFNRSWVLHRPSNSDLSNFDGEWVTEKLHDFWAKRKANLITNDTQVLDTTVSTLQDARTRLVTPFSESWHVSMW